VTMNAIRHYRSIQVPPSALSSTGVLLFTVAILALTLRLNAEEPSSPPRPTEADYYAVTELFTSRTLSHSRDTAWRPGKGVAMEVGGLDVLPDGRLAVAIRKGEVWLIENPSAESVEFMEMRPFAVGLHEPLGVLYHDKSLYVTQRTELTRLRDTDGDGLADEYIRAAGGWHVSGNYHEYIFGPKRDGHGNLWITTNLGIGQGSDNKKPWRGWGLMLTPEGDLKPMCAGMRSPSGIGANAAGDMFFTDQQGNWVPTNTLHHLRKGAFYGHPDGLAPQARPDAPFDSPVKTKRYASYTEAVKAIPQLVPPAVWFPYMKMGRSATDILLDDTGGRFGPFAGQLFVGDFTHSSIHRVFLEKVDGEYQGACFPFREGFPAAVVRMALTKKIAKGDNAEMFVGMTNRGWNSRGDASYGLHRLKWTGKTPFEIKTMQATPEGFRLTFTQPIDPVTASDPAGYRMISYTYPYSSAYGGDEIQTKQLTVSKAIVSKDRRSVHLIVSPLRPLFVHELKAAGVRSASGVPLLHPDAYYTLNRIP